MPNSISPTSQLGPVHLVPGVSKANALTYLYSAFAGVALTSFISVIMPYFLNANLKLPVEEQGQVAGDLVFYGEIVMLTMSGIMGAWSDKFGRRPVFVAGLIVLAIGYAALGFTMTLGVLIAVRVFTTFGITAVSVMVTAVQVDYPVEKSRGKLVGFAGIAIGIGQALLGVVLLVPNIFANAGYDEVMSGRLTVLCVTAFCIFTAIIVHIGLVGGKPPGVDDKPSTRELVANGLAAAKRNVRIALVYGCAFVGRADMVVVGTFYSLWLTQAGLAAGLSVDEAAKTAGLMFALVMVSALLWAPIMGWLNDRLNRTRVMAISLGLAAISYSLMGLIEDPLGFWIYAASVLLGIGQMSVTLASQTLLGQEAPKKARGSIVGTFNLFGAAGILFVTSVGGRVYDLISPSAPFVMVGMVNGLLFLGALWLLLGKNYSPQN